MLVITQNKKCIVNMDAIITIHIEDGTLIASDVASDSYVIAQFPTEEDAKKALHDLVVHNNTGAGSFDFESYTRMTQNNSKITPKEVHNEEEKTTV